VGPDGTLLVVLDVLGDVERDVPLRDRVVAVIMALRAMDGHSQQSGSDDLQRIGDDLQLRFTATVDAPPFELLEIPAAPDSSTLLPERGPRRTGRNVLIGLGLGAATVFAATLFAGSDDVASASSPTRAYAVGAGMTVGALLGVLTDRGPLLTDNVAHNREVEEQFREQVRQLQAENARRRSAYRTAITIQGSP